MTISCCLMGGLGNQLFQIFATMALAMQKGESFCFTNATTLGGEGCTTRYTYWDTFLSSLRPFLQQNITPYSHHVIQEKGFRFDTDLKKQCLVEKNKNIMLKGYFQSPRYFESHFSWIIRFLNIQKQREHVNEKYIMTTLSEKNVPFEHTISMHFRLGDYVNLPQHHPLATFEYYTRALEWISMKTQNKMTHVLVFCEESDFEIVQSKINIFQTQFPSFTFVFAPFVGFVDWEHMLLQSLCRHHVIANSTFSWWGAYLNPNSNTWVTYPEPWFGSACSPDHKTFDLCPEHWQKITC